MSRWIEMYENHPFQQKWKAFGQLIKEDFLSDSADESSVKELMRLRKAYNYIESIIESTDPDLFTNSLLNELSSSTETAFNEANAYRANKQLGHLQNANSQVDNLLLVSQRLPATRQPKLKNSLPSIVSSYSRELDQHLDHIKTEVDTRIKNFETQSANTTNDYNNLLQKLNELRTQIATVEQTIQRQTAEFNSQFQVDQKERREIFEKDKQVKLVELQKIIDITQSNFEKLVLDTNTEADKEFKNLVTKSATILEIMTSHQQNAEQVLGVVVNTAQAGAYKSYANDERSTANIYRYLAVSLMIFGVSVIAGPEIIKMVEGLGSYSVNWEQVLWRLPISAIMFLPAFYLARESDKHRRNEFSNRRRELILCSVDPYLALLDKSKRDELKLEIAKDIFKDSQSVEFPVKNIDLAELLSQVANFVKQVK